MIDDKERFAERFYGIRRLGPVQDSQSMVLVKPKLKPPIVPSVSIGKNAKNTHKDLFAPMNCFASTTTSCINVSKLYKHKLLPSQYLSTSAAVIKKLTRQIYISPKHESFPFTLPAPKKLKKKKRNSKVNSSYKEDLSQISGDYLRNTCINMLENTQKSRVVLKKRAKVLEKQVAEVKKAISSVERSNKRVGYYLFHNKLQQGHEYLLKLNMIHGKAPEKLLNCTST